MDPLDQLINALRPLVAVADAYDDNALDEARPAWTENKFPNFTLAMCRSKDKDVELFNGRGGKPLIKLMDAFAAREALKLLTDMQKQAQEVGQ